MKAIALALFLFAPLAFAGVVWNVTGKVLSFDAKNVTLAIEGAGTQLTVPRDRLPLGTRVRPGAPVTLTLRASDIARTSAHVGAPRK